MQRSAPMMLGCLLAAPLAHAGPGDHIRVGSVEIAPGIDLGGEYRTNVFRDEDTEIGAGNLLIAPKLDITFSNDDAELGIGGDWQLRKYVVSSEGGDVASSLDRFDDFSVGAHADIGKRSRVGLRVSDRLVQRNWSTDAQFAEFPYASQIQNNLIVGIPVRLGSALEVTPGGMWKRDDFRFPDNDERGFNVRNTYGGELAARWAFLPRTNLVAEGSYLLNQWEANAVDATNIGDTSTLRLPNSYFAQGLVGLDGQVTERISLRTTLGYGTGAYDDAGVDADVGGGDALSAEAQIAYMLSLPGERSRGNRLSLAYGRDFRDSFFTNYVVTNGFKGEYTGQFGAWLPGAGAEFRTERYVGDVVRSDVVLRMFADLDLLVDDSFTVGAGAWRQQRDSDSDTIDYADIGVRVTARFVY